MNGIRQLFLFIIILFLQIKSACSLCNMPTAWLGSWYQRGMSSLLEITIDHIQTKGRCLDGLPIQQYYLFTDRINRCTRCLLFIQRHTNLLQYRESECSDADDLSSVTSCPNMIAPDAALYTLHRNNSKPQLCPIQPPFLLTNLMKDGSTCRQSLSSSYIGECANDYQFRLHLLPCSSYQKTLDLQFVCVGTWIEGFHTYFVAHILSHSFNQYACFHFVTKQKDLSPSFSLSMASDDSCRDLNSKYMSTVMTLSSINRQMSNESNLSCVFPDEFQQYEWYSLNRTIRMIITNNDIELIDNQQIGNNKRFHCLESISSANSIFNYRIRAFTNCNVNEECLQINQRTNNVLELFISHCNNNEYNRTLTFFTKSNSLSSCPTSIGHLLLESSLNHHRQLFLRKQIFQMSVGCDNKQKLIISQTDKDPKYRSITQMDTCLASWQSDDLTTMYLIAQSIYSNASYCLSFQMSDSIIIRNSSHQCSFNNYDDETSISIYSAKLINPCSQSQRISLKYMILFLAIFFSVNNVR